MSAYQSAQSPLSFSRIKYFLIVLLLAITLPVVANEAPEIMLANTYRQNEDVTQFWVSEKLDGVRARWDGKQLISRGGSIFMVPAWFIQGFPDQLLDGELWMGRGHYQDVVSVVRKQSPDDGWKAVKFMVFDLPAHGGTFTERVEAMRQLATTPHLQMIEQFRVASNKALMDKLDTLVKQGGEGLVLHRQNALYHSGRSDDLLKLKPFEDAEAIVIGYKPGKGKNTGLMGAIKVRIDNGKEFYIGSGFTQQQRKNPPALGSLVTYRYQGFTRSGIPRFAVFIRQRNE
ncbi:DNA ligase [Methylobacter psychrophilus]|uniref:DNA ligase n=1 Tax=Methylobacter psychrophilus TaxID=96941 RepID=UPI0021D497CC|nr:DNA ligase [Methylobacter psychrophilus]